ncbi:permease [Acetobacterium wieringae]|uniref:Putative permease n=1 Tax=Acetobacterium wieringae TaxID=52694 RepID=A0A1F2PJN6_9FIRM|nr:permease [Acetobacterium wieringae]OFV71134.1 putative permease [Acetobacterium wieringae]
MMTIVFYGLAAIGLVFSLVKSREKTKMALIKALKAFENILPQFLGIVLLIGVILSLLSPQQISQLIGENSGWVGVVIATVIGSITLIPGFLAFPLAAALLQNGAGYMQIGAFVSSLMMVGIVTMPVEVLYFGKKATLLRNGMGLVFSILVAMVIGGILS